MSNVATVTVVPAVTPIISSADNVALSPTTAAMKALTVVCKVVTAVRTALTSTSAEAETLMSAAVSVCGATSEMVTFQGA